MWISEIAERAIWSAMSGLDVTFRTLPTMSGLDVTFRLSRVDDDETAQTERKKYPCMVIVAEGGSKDTTEALFDTVPVAVTISTHYTDDPKRTVLAGLEDEFRTILDAKIATSTVRTAFNAVALAASSTRYSKGITEISGGPIELTDNKEQSILTTFKLNVCGA